MRNYAQNSRYKKRIHSRTLAGKRTFSVLNYSTIVRPRMASKLIKTFFIQGIALFFQYCIIVPSSRERLKPTGCIVTPKIQY
ncbi:hypothetical protein [Salmonella phage SD-1_S14]|nr:hypothetical protein [Salmonella phage SD-2_S15]WPK19164.1 hypothetical protein [Salmonella phage SD-6_S16]WPK19833.1 hypothetical protein [Salmonella phage SD-1_S14]WPK20860.1 hypothetical protein [Salmonella phage SD-15_S21]